MKEADKSHKKIKFSQVFKSFLKVISWAFKANRYAFPILMVCLILTSLLPFLGNYIQSEIIDEITRLLTIEQSNRTFSVITTLIIFGILIAIFEKILWAIVALADKIHYFGLGKYVEMAFLTKASSLDMYHYENPKTNQLIQKVREIYEHRPKNIVNRLVWSSGDVVRIISSIVILISFSFPAFLLVLLTSIPSLIAGYKLGHGSWGIWDANALDKQRYWWSKDMLSRDDTLMELRIFRTKDYLFKTVESIYDKFTNKEKKDQTRRAFVESLVGNLSTLGYLAFWIIAIIETINGQISIGLLTFYIASMNTFSQALPNFFRSISSQYEDSLFLVDFFKFMELENKIVNGSVKLKEQVRSPKIEFKNVYFKYPETDKFVLHNFNLVIESGEKVAFVGVNGSGKTTVVKLLCRFYDVDEGEILIDGINIKELDLDSWYKKIGVLFQDFIKYGQFSVKTNIELGDVGNLNDEEKVNDAIFKSDSKEFIEDYKHKLEQILDKAFEDGISPSGGQWQRIALARAFFRDAPVLILDEPTSAIDAKGEYEIFQRLYKFSESKTLIIISHRFSTVRQADKIYVIENGEIVENGSHSELLELNGKYADAFRTQAKGYS